MANFTVDLPGQINKDGSKRALYLKLFGQEVKAAYYAKTQMRDKIRLMEIERGKEYQFPCIGRTTAAYHTPGVEITGSQLNHNEVVISVDAKLVASVTIDDLDAILSSYELRGYYTNACAEALADAFERNCFRQIARATASAHPITGEPGGKVIYNVDITTGATPAANAKALYQAIKSASEELVKVNRDPKFTETWCVLSPTNYYLLLEHLDLLNRDYAGSGSLLTADVPMIANIKIFHSNLFEAGSNITSSSPGNYVISEGVGKYDVNMSKTIALIWNAEAVGCVQAMGLEMKAEYYTNRLAWLVLAVQAHGWGTLIPTNAIQLNSGTAGSFTIS